MDRFWPKLGTHLAGPCSRSSEIIWHVSGLLYSESHTSFVQRPATPPPFVTPHLPMPRGVQPAINAAKQVAKSARSGPAAQPLRYAPVVRNSTPKPKAVEPISQESRAEDELKQARRRKFFLYPAGFFGFAIAFYSASLYTSLSHSLNGSADPKDTSVETQKDVADVYDRTAASFDADVNISEWLQGITSARRKIAAQCKGDVLEVSCGTARNLGYYQFGKEGVRSLTLIDLSEQMVEVAKKKWDALKQGGEIRRAMGVPVRFLKGDVRGEMVPPPELPNKEGSEKEEGRKKGYDAIVQTMGLCSTPSPVQLLRNLAAHLNPENPDAKILLIEHGRSYYQWLNRILDSEASQHADQHGCWWNREIEDIVAESGLEVVSERRKQFGTVYIYELKPGKAQQPGKPEGKSETPQTDGKASWSSWLPSLG
ncbi:hypothetical protein M8818_007849 [Zalaria obscura]|uniref:Uncharacterized protein n=1 Tax=Zalaria obscura TaxID=2024903 RepID=A0ACC3S3E4_9PEZI